MQNNNEAHLKRSTTPKENHPSDSLQTIHIMGNTIINENRLEVENAPATTSSLLIRNHKIVTSEEKLLRIIEIQLEDKVIKIMDTFTGASFLEYDKTIISQDLLNSQVHYQKEYTKSQSSKGGTSNNASVHMNAVNRTIFKMFKEWVKESTPPELQLQDNLQLICKRKEKYHQNFLVEISKDPELRGAFLAFCSDAGQKMVLNSKIKEKYLYLTALQNYQKRLSQDLPIRTLTEGKKIFQRNQMSVSSQKINTSRQ